MLIKAGCLWGFTHFKQKFCMESIQAYNKLTDYNYIKKVKIEKQSYFHSVFYDYFDFLQFFTVFLDFSIF